MTITAAATSELDHLDLKDKQLASFTQSSSNQMQKMEAEVMITMYIFARFGHYCSDLYAGSFMAYLHQPVGQQGVSQGGLMAWGGWSSLAAMQRSMHLGVDALASCVAFLGPALLWSACFGADHGGRRAFKMVAAIGRGSSNLVNAAGS